MRWDETQLSVWGAQVPISPIYYIHLPWLENSDLIYHRLSCFLPPIFHSSLARFSHISHPSQLFETLQLLPLKPSNLFFFFKLSPFEFSSLIFHANVFPLVCFQISAFISIIFFEDLLIFKGKCYNLNTKNEGVDCLVSMRLKHGTRRNRHQPHKTSAPSCKPNWGIN